MTSDIRPLAIVTGASAGIGYELAKCCAQQGFDLLVAADQSAIHDAAQDFRALGATVEAIEADLATLGGVDQLYAAAKGRPVEALLANAGHGLGHGFLDQSFEEVRHVIDTNITGTLYLIQKVGREMHARGQGRILITGSIAGFMPGTFQAVYSGTKAFMNSFSFALRSEMQNSGVTVTCLMPGPTETEFFERADMLDTQVGQQEKDDPAEVAKIGFEAMMKGEQHRKMAEPGSSKR
jgi:short-subunit dehydrogenase